MHFFWFTEGSYKGQFAVLYRGLNEKKRLFL